MDKASSQIKQWVTTKQPGSLFFTYTVFCMPQGYLYWEVLFTNQESFFYAILNKSPKKLVFFPSPVEQMSTLFYDIAAKIKNVHLIKVS